MAWLLETPLALRLAAIFVVASFVATLVNAAIYAWAWDRRLVSPWQPPPEGAGPRTWLDKVPILGWFRLRRDSGVIGRGFWVRPMLIELGFAAGLCWLYWWEVERLGLITPQLAAWGAADGPVDRALIAGPLHWQLLAHALLAALMTIATFIDFDERIIPDEITFPGTLLGLLLAATLPMCLLPTIEQRAAAPVAGVALETVGPKLRLPMLGPGGQLYLEPTHVASPRAWPDSLAGGQNHSSLAIGLACYWLWCFALTDRRWPRGKRFGKKLGLVLARVRRDLTRRPLREALVAGTLLIAMVWFAGGPHWVGLLSALVGLAVAGGIVWAVRIIGTMALGVEAMGFGDVTLMMMVGTLTGWQAAPLIFFLAPVAGLLLAVVNLLVHGDRAIPFGPFLCLATLFVIAAWGPLWVWATPLFAAGWLVPMVLIVCFVLLGVLLGLLQGLKYLMGFTGED